MIYSLFWEGDVYSRGGVYFKIRDFRGRSFEGRLFEAGRLFEEIRYGNTVCHKFRVLTSETKHLLKLSSSYSDLTAT